MITSEASNSRSIIGRLTVFAGKCHGPRSAKFAILALGANVALFLLQLHVMDLLVASQHGTSIDTPGHASMSAADFMHLAYPVFTRDGHPSERLHAVLILVAVLQSAVFFGIWKTLRTALDVKLIRVLVAVCAVVMFGLALCAKSLASLDVYSYIGYGKLGLAHAYSPIADQLPPAFAIVNKLWDLPHNPCVYGPLWLVFQQIASGWTSSVGQAVLATRLLACLCVLGLVFALSRLKVPRIVYPLVLLNPAIITSYVVNAHNDLLGVIFVLLALSAVSSAPLLAALLVACAGLAKVSLIGLALVVFRPPLSLKMRCLCVSVAIAALVLGSYLLGGAHYFFNLAYQIADNNADSRHYHPQGLLLVVLEVVALGVLLTAFARGYVFRSGAWPLYTMSGMSYPWYFIWGLPYAALSESGLSEFLILLPTVSAMTESSYQNLHYETVIMALTILYVLHQVFYPRLRGIVGRSALNARLRIEVARQRTATEAINSLS